MSEKTIINITLAPQPVGPYSQGVKFGDIIFLSGQLPVDPKTNKIISEDVSNQTKQCFENIKSILEPAGSSLFNILKTTVFLTNMDDFAAMNTVYAQYFPHEPPARSCVQVAKLPLNAKVEIETIAYLPKPQDTGLGLFGSKTKSGPGLMY